MVAPRNPPQEEAAYKEPHFDGIEDDEEGKRPRQATHFGVVVQLDEPHQMEVLRWLKNDSTYRIIWILHDRDFHDDGTRKAPHIHGIVKAPRKMQGKTMLKRFGGYLYFKALGDPAEYARYLTHSTFASRGKTRYDSNEIQGDLALYNELVRMQEATPIEAVERWIGYKKAFVASGGLDELPSQLERREIEKELDKGALALALDAGDIQLVKSIMSHSYFYKSFT